MSQGLDILPSPRREIVRAAIVAAFGSAPVGAVTRLHGGATGAAPLCVEVGGRRYLVRAEGEASPLRNPHQYQSMRIAAESGIAPRVHYIDETARVAVTDFIDQQPLHTYPGGPRSLAQALGELLHRLQDTPVFPAFVDYPVIVGRLFAHVRRTGLFAEGLLDPHTERLARVSATYDAGVTQLVSSHNDFIPANILFDGARLWVIDWESAYRNDPLVDVATALDTRARSPELEEVPCAPGSATRRTRRCMPASISPARWRASITPGSFSVPRQRPGERGETTISRRRRCRSSSRRSRRVASSAARRRQSTCWARCTSPRSFRAACRPASTWPSDHWFTPYFRSRCSVQSAIG